MKTQIYLPNTKLENVFKYLFDKFPFANETSQIKTVHRDDYPDKISRNIIYHHILKRPRQDDNKLIIKEQDYISAFPGKTDPTAEEVIFNYYSDGLVFSGWQLQTNTVQLQIDYLDNWQDLGKLEIVRIAQKFHRSTAIRSY